MKLAITALVVTLLAGCVSAQDAAWERELQQRRADAQREQYRQQVLGQCRGYGLLDGSEDFKRCVMQVDMASRQQNEAQRQMLIQQYIQQQGIFRR